MYKRKVQKKELEEYYLKKFISNPSLGLRIKSIKSSESPDFIINELHETISIEVMRLVDPKQKELEVLQERIVEQAYLMFKEEFNEKLRVLVGFSRSTNNYKKVGQGPLSSMLFKKVREVYLNNKEYVFNLRTKREEYNDFFDSISISNDLAFDNWQPFGAYLVNPIDLNWLSKQIDVKAGKLKGYSERFDKNWLLLVANLGNRSSAADLINIDEFKKDSGFDRVYLYSVREDEVTLLK